MFSAEDSSDIMEPHHFDAQIIQENQVLNRCSTRQGFM
jgi:hypothetical protein